MLRRGDKGDDVQAWQESLLKMGYSLPNYGADADFGGETEAATRTFQSASKLTASGIVDNPTYSAMQRAMIAEMTKDDSYITELANKLALSNSALASSTTQLQAEKKKVADYNTALANLK
jgi:peptidoglycan hydrolase-like protein with peptidoglycan-binding domain